MCVCVCVCVCVCARAHVCKMSDQDLSCNEKHTFLNVEMSMSSALGSLCKGLTQIRTQGMQSMDNCIIRFILYGLLYRLKSIASTLKPPFTQVHDHEKLLPHLARNHTSMNNSNKMKRST